MDKKTKDKITDLLTKLLIDKESSDSVYWKMWCLINALKNKINLIEHQDLMKKLVIFTDYMEYR